VLIVGLRSCWLSVCSPFSRPLLFGLTLLTHCVQEIVESDKSTVEFHRFLALGKRGLTEEREKVEKELEGKRDELEALTAQASTQVLSLL
jgi:hypothetical protein